MRSSNEGQTALNHSQTHRFTHPWAGVQLLVVKDHVVVLPWPTPRSPRPPETANRFRGAGSGLRPDNDVSGAA